MIFDEYYYAHGCGSTAYGSTPEWHQKFARIADAIVAELGPRRVLDAGCAMGLLVAALRERGVEAYGIDISEYAISRIAEELRPYCSLGSISEPFEQDYDLIISIEVLEHMPADQAELAIDNFCKHSKQVLFSSTPLDFKEATHVNVRNPEAWATLFARHNFFRDVDFDASVITPWALCFQHRSEPAARIIRDYERRFWELWKETTDLRALADEQRHNLANNATILEVLQQRESQIAANAQETQQYIKELEATIQIKNKHIAELERLLARIQQGRVLRIIQGIQRRRRP